MQRPNPQVFRTADARFSLVIEDTSLESLHQLCAASAPLETGGILIGSYDEQGTTATVTRVKGPAADSEREHARFRRGTLGLQSLLERLWKRKEHYLGEWHFHPGGLPNPSSVDVRQMESIAEDQDACCPEPLLLVIGRDRSMTLHVFPRGEAAMQLEPYRKRPSQGVQSDKSDR